MEQNIDLKLSKFGRLKWACRVVILLATAVSVWANFLHSRSDLRSVGINIMPPLLVFVGFELGSRIPLRQGAWYVKAPRPLAMGVIAGIGAWLSYWHQNAAFSRYADTQTAILLPIAIDGLMVVASVALLDLNAKVREFEARKEGIKITVNRPKPEAPVTKMLEPATKRDRIIELLKHSPDLSMQQIAKKTESAYGYVAAVRAELKKATETTRDSELVSA